MRKNPFQWQFLDSKPPHFQSTKQNLLEKKKGPNSSTSTFIPSLNPIQFPFTPIKKKKRTGKQEETSIFLYPFTSWVDQNSNEETEQNEKQKRNNRLPLPVRWVLFCSIWGSFLEEWNTFCVKTVNQTYWTWWHTATLPFCNHFEKHPFSANHSKRWNPFKNLLKNASCNLFFRFLCFAI